ncbi:MAG: hypothetical protein GWM87_02450 [Xanthomonadales bacterium]|nr:hypothetical protein [Xanthomonadales bacterium]NIX11924.1 hypothetical protein [Xanthomonadales bacterium]
MLLYNLAAAVFILVAVIVLITVNWYTALVPVGISVALYFIGQSNVADDPKKGRRY